VGGSFTGLGVMFIIVGVLGALFGTCLIGLDEALKGELTQGERDVLRIPATFLGFVLLAIVGVLFVRHSDRSLAQAVRMGSKFIGIVLVLLLVAFAGLIYGFAACF
jgi:hypothetical protein